MGNGVDSMLLLLRKLIVLVLFFGITSGSNINFDDIDGDVPKIFNYSAYLRKPHLVETDSKIKVETLGEVLKSHIKLLKDTPNKEVDLVFIVDSSTSVGKRNFLEELKFVKKLLSDFTVHKDRTRVAVITYSSRERIIRQVNYLDHSSKQRNKCSLLEEDLQRIAYSGGGTYTRGAFLEAREVLKHARPTASRAIFLVTDGFSNGGDPRQLARAIRQEGVKIFTVGIQNGNVQELLDMASEPKNETCYILDSFKEFEALARRALHEDLTSGQYVTEPNRRCNRLCVGRNCCDPMAKCHCGVHTGKYECVCPPGYYGNGLKGGCLACPSGTYKSESKPGDVYTCQACPDEHQVTEPGSISQEQCICRKGYRNFNGTGCAVLRCPDLEIPENGYFVNDKCKNVFNAACGLRCKPGYELRGSGLRICREDGTWSGTTTQCIMKTCPAVMKPKNGNMICATDDFTFNTVCRFTCDAGYKLVGSRKRTCLAISLWTGINTRCREIVCQPLPRLRDGKITEQCTAGEVPFGTTCDISCISGYNLIGPHTMQCMPNGMWTPEMDGVISQCVDTTPPFIMCPDDIETETDLDENTVEVTWNVPLAVDNSGYIPILTSVPAVIPPTRFPSGITKVVYIAEDLGKNKAKCAFYILVKDNQPPTVDRCFSPQPVVSSEPYAEVAWDEPLFSDNSGQNVRVQRSHAPGLFHKGETEVTYTAYDASDNSQSCVLTIKVIPHPCEYPPVPVNGNRTCTEDEDGVVCKFACHENYAFAVPPAEEYRCAFNNVWEPWERLPVPDCSVQQLSNDLLQPASLTFAGDVSCTERLALVRLEAEFEQLVNNRLSELCEDDVSCYVEEMETTCQHSNDFNTVKVVLGRNKRGLPRYRRATEHLVETTTMATGTESKALITFDYLLAGSVKPTGVPEADIKQQQDLLDAMEKVRDVLTMEAKTGKFNMSMNGQKLEVTDVSYDLESKFKCKPGSILNDNACVQCPRGMFFNVVSEQCESCRKGSFQPLDGQLTCMVCPGNTSTDDLQATSVDMCKDLCLPGTFSATGLERCETCRKGYFQSEYGMTECEKCPRGYKTKGRGSRTSDKCKEKCSVGHVSKTGLEPCYPCPRGTYQEKEGKMSCFTCPGQAMTPSSGTTDATECENLQADSPQGDTNPFSVGQEEYIPDDCVTQPCPAGSTCVATRIFGFECICPAGYTGTLCEQKIDHCAVNPCMNGGECESLLSEYSCTCPVGFTGQKCEVNVDDCVSNPCLNDGACVDQVNSYSCSCANGFEGLHCEVNIDDCASSPCLNEGTCHDEVAAFSCTCPPGTLGDTCEIDVDDCVSHPCQNGATCLNAVGYYMCICAEGFIGPSCETDINECDPSPCSEGSTCEDLEGRYHCICQPGFSGDNCTEELHNYYQLDFPATASTMDYARVDMTKDLSAATACFWMKSSDTKNQGTPFSYATDEGSDNAFTVTDYDGVTVYVNGQTVSTNVRANDGVWHHICVVWSSNRGSWKIYLDGQPEDSGRGLASGEVIKGGGSFVVGQEQDSVGGDFSSPETFIGTLSQLNVWSRELSLKNIEALRLSCEKQIGDVVAWPNIATGMHGILSDTPVDFCRECPVPSSIHYGDVSYTGLSAGSEATYSCSRGFNVAGRSVRQCLVTGEWEGAVPSCRPVQCRYPFILNGWVQGDRYTYDNRIRYKCDNGYELVAGNSTRICQANGRWDGTEPRCEEIMCEIPPLSENTLVINPRPDNRYPVNKDVYFECKPGQIFYTDHDSVYCQKDGTFDLSIPTCDPQTCGAPPTPDDTLGLRDVQEEYQVGSEVQYECGFGFMYSPGNPQGSLYCLPTGDWEENYPVCVLVQCPEPASIPNGDVEWTGLEFLETVTYTCDLGYQIQGAAVIDCLEFGDWELPPPQCLPVSCGRPDLILFGDYEVDKYTLGGLAVYTCNLGYVLSGGKDRECLANATWSGDSPACKPVSCGKPEELSHGTVTGRQYTLNSEVQYQCNPGYELQGFQNNICRETKKWQNPTPSCDKIQCERPSEPEHGHYTGNSFFFEETVEYQCEEGYTLIGEANLTCSSDRSWSPAIPECQANMCENLKNIDHGLYQNPDSLTSFPVGYKVQFVCVDGYEISVNSLNPLGQVACLPSGEWEANYPVCEIIECLPPPDIDHGSNSYESLQFSSTAVYQCQEGYQLAGEKESTCQADRTWSGSLPVCDPIMCQVPRKVDNARLDYKSLKLGTVVRYLCAEGHELLGAEVRRCLANLTWSGEEPECRPVQCKDPGEVDFSLRHLSGLEYQSTVSYVCHVGYSLMGDGVRVCNKHAEWTGKSPVCDVVQCDKPADVISNGRMLGTVFSYKSIISYECDEGYLIDGPTERRCLSSGEWDNPIPVCEAVECPRLFVSKGSTSSFERGYGTVQSISCQPGYKLIGPSQRTCLASGQWSGEVSRCVRYQCPRLAPPVNGQVLVQSGVATYTCLFGFIMNGTERRDCQADETWSPAAPTCEPTPCPDITAEGFQHGSMTYNQLSYGSSIIYDCNTGFILSGDRKLDCLVDGTWSGEAPICDKITCFKPFLVRYSKILGDDFSFNATIQYECETGYQLVGDDDTRQCLVNGSWSGVAPRCELVYCPRALPGAFVKISGTSNTYNSNVSYSCIPGFELVGPETRTCQNSGEWSGTDPTCVRIECPKPKDLENGHIYAQGYDQGSSINYECNEGYSLEGLQFRLCLASKLWTGSDPRCVKVKCPTPPALQNGVVIGDSWQYQDTVQYDCDDGYDLVGAATRTCLSVGRWSGANPSCIKVSCGPPLLPDNAVFSLGDGSEEGTFGINATLGCEEGYIGVGTNYQFCQANGAWSQSNFKCETVYCPEYRVLSHGTVSGSSYQYGDDLLLQCDEGYKLRGDSKITCIGHGFWSYEVEPECVQITCPKPSFFGNGRISPSNRIFSVGMQITYSCNEGYRVSGPTYRVCQKDETWSGSESFCRLIVCPDPLFVNNSEAVDTARRYLLGDEVRYICSHGYFKSAGDSVLFCDQSGQWAGVEPVCARIQCGPPGRVYNAKFSSTGEDFDSVTTYTCDDGFRLKGNANIRCLDTGLWSTNTPACVPVSCGAPQRVQNSVIVDTEQHTFNSVITYICDEGYRLIGEQTSHCEASGTWSGVPPDCQPITCAAPPDIPYTKYTGDLLTFKSTITYNCLPGYELVGGEATLICSSSGFWVGNRAQCEPISCGPPDTIPHASITMSMDANHRSYATFLCNNGYYLVGSSRATCGNDRMWKIEEAPSCEPVNCGNLSPIPHASLLLKETTFNSIGVYVCDPGYYMKQEGSMRCNEDGKWKGDPVLCEPVSCGLPPHPDNALINGFDYTFGSTVEYSCLEGYLVVGDSSLQCTAAGKWAGQAPQCLRIDCGPLLLPHHGFTLLGDETAMTFAGHSVEFACDEGYDLAGSSKLTCQVSGFWDSEVPTCNLAPSALTCPPDTGVGNARPLDGDGVPVGSDATLVCNHGYRAVGDLTIHCWQDRTWSKPIGRCQKVFCGKPRLRDFVNVVGITGRSYFYGDKIQYRCRAGVPPARVPAAITCTVNGTWDGQIACGVTCKLPCQNGGICLGLNRCKCPTGYGGPQCQTAICVLPCLNGGSCIAPYQCDCPPGYTGTRCNQAVCNKPCQNGGRCIRPNRCKCPHGFAPPFCGEKYVP